MKDRLVEVVIDKFRDKVDKGGHPYIEHLYRVADGAEELQVGSYMTGFLHDTLEDTDLTADDLFLLGVSNAVINRVSILTKPHDMPYEKYIMRIKNYARKNKDKIILAVKIADLNDNLNVSRLKMLKDEDFKRLVRYMKARQKLSDVLNYLQGHRRARLRSRHAESVVRYGFRAFAIMTRKRRFSRITVWRAIAARASSRLTLWARMPVRAVTIWPTGG